MKKKEIYSPPQLIALTVRSEGVLCGSVRGVYDSGIDSYEYEDKSDGLTWS